MNSRKKRIVMIAIVFFTIIAVLVGSGLYFFMKMGRNEDPKWWYLEKKVSAIEARYKGEYPQNAIVFAGSSFIENWGTLENDMSPLTVLNNGIGGTKIADSVFYADRLVVPFTPKAIVLYAGSNDINGIEGNSKTGEQVYQRVIKYFTTVHQKLPNVPIYYISIAPTPLRWDVWPEAEKANQLIKEYCKQHKDENLIFIDATAPLLNEEGRPKPEIFGKDHLHFNQKGYVIWTDVIKPILQKDLEHK